MLMQKKKLYNMPRYVIETQMFKFVGCFRQVALGKYFSYHYFQE